MQIRIEPGQLAKVLLQIVATLTVINCVVAFFYYYYDDYSVFGLVDLFDLSIEHNVPTFYSAVAILLASVQLALLARADRGKPEGRRGYWIALSLIFLFLAVDESVAIHEEIGDFFERYIEATGYLYYMWVVPYGIAVIVIGLFFLRFVLSLPATTRNRFIAAGVIFLAGAIGLELPGAREADIHGTDTILYFVLYTLEEVLEMLGIVLFNYALLSHLTTEHGRVVCVLTAGDDADRQVRARSDEAIASRSRYNGSR
jgi:hypothetical protein